ncbi:MAG: hypothetical protein N2255_02720 [Kiritimatiellae bacterium]|nr:hypothetical protein [Kiritimatiellia bacterium]
MKRRDLVVIGIFVVLMTVINVGLVMSNRLPWTGRWDWSTLSIMVGAAITIALYSQLYSDNALFRMAEHMFVGTSVGYGLVMAWYLAWVSMILNRKAAIDQHLGFWQAIREGAKVQQLGIWSLIIPGILGLMVYGRLTRRYGWISRIPFAMMIGFGVGYAIPTTISANLLTQLKPMMVDLLHGPTGGVHWNGIIILVGVLSTLVYFFFSAEHKGIIRGISRTGVLFLMVAFGASFGYTVMARLSLLIGRIDFLFREWLPLLR